MMKHVFTVIGEEAGQTLVELLCGRQDLRAPQAEAWISGGSVYLDGRRHLSAGTRLRPGQRVVAHQPEDLRAQEPAVAFLDHEVAVVVKPAGLPSTPTRKGGVLTVEAFIRQRLGETARLLHRLDREASGLLLVSLRRGETRQRLSQELSSHRARRCYLALVDGVPPQQEMSWETPLAVERGRTRASSDPRARPARTRARMIQRHGARSLLQVEPLTGRTHQIRAHLSLAGLPIIGDARYGGPPAARLALHAHALRFRHPRGRVLELHSPLPRDFKAVLISE